MLDLLTKIGLDETEVKVYLALLELGPSTVTEITHKAGITRTLGYHTLEKLGWQGLVNQITKNDKIMTYSAEHPQRLLQFGKNKENQIKKSLGEIENHLPNLISLYKKAEKPVIKYKEGLSGVVDIFYDWLEAKSDILVLWDLNAWLNSGIIEHGLKTHRERIKRKKKARILVLDTPASRRWIKDHKISLQYTQYRWVKPEQLPGITDFGGELNIYDNKLNIITLKKPNQLGVIIESGTLANLMRAMFEMAWQMGAPVKNIAKHPLAKKNNK